VKVLKEISMIEDRINSVRNDQGREDNILFVVSLSTLIKVINSTPAPGDAFVSSRVVG
jgi:hypothetical protein